jgi:hypothetical protein
MIVEPVYNNSSIEKKSYHSFVFLIVVTDSISLTSTSYVTCTSLSSGTPLSDDFVIVFSLTSNAFDGAHSMNANI